MTLILHCLSDYYHIFNGFITFGYYEESKLNSELLQEGGNPQINFMLLRKYKNLCVIHIEVSWWHVKGHQDNYYGLIYFGYSLNILDGYY